MKKLLSLFFAMFLMLFAQSLVQAEYKENRDYYLGEIKSIDKIENKITIFDYVDGRERIFFVENGLAQDLKPGIEVMVSTLKGSNTAKRVKIIIQRSINI